MTDWSGRHIIRGIANELMERLPKEAVQGPNRLDWGCKDAATAAYWAQRTAAFHGIVTWSPTIDPEALKTLSMQMVIEAKVRLLLHAWVTAPILEGNVVKGAIFESKEGRHAVFAKVVIDTTGDADLIARTHAGFESDIDEGDIHHCINTAFLLGGVDMERWLSFRSDEPEGFAQFMAQGRKKLKFFEKPFVSWRNDIALFMGPRLAGYSAVNVEDLSAVELRSRQLAVGHLEIYRTAAPGFGNAFLMLGAPQIGVRHSRRLNGLRKVTRAQWDTGKVCAEVPQHLRTLWSTGAGGARQHFGRRPPCRLRCELPHLPAGDTAMLAHWPSRGRRRSAGGRRRHVSAQGGRARPPAGTAAAGRLLVAGRRNGLQSCLSCRVITPSQSAGSTSRLRRRARGLPARLGEILAAAAHRRAGERKLAREGMGCWPWPGARLAWARQLMGQAHPHRA